MRISDWSSDVCSSDLLGPDRGDRAAQDAVGQGLVARLSPRRADPDLRRQRGGGDFRPLAGPSWRQASLTPLKAKLSRPRSAATLFPPQPPPRGSRSYI